MLWSTTLIPTIRPPAPNSAEQRTVTGEQLLLHAGFVRQRASGVYDLLPLGVRVVNSIACLLRAASESVGGREVSLPLPAVHPVTKSMQPAPGAHHANETGFAAAAADIIAANVHSYLQLPLQLYQIGRREAEPFRHRSGLYHQHDTVAFDACTFAATEVDRRNLQQQLFSALSDTISSLRLATAPATAASGEELAVVSPSGPEHFFRSGGGDYFATRDAARTADRHWSISGEPTADLELIQTPGVTSVDDAAAALHVAPRDILKTLVFRATSPVATRWVVAVVRGDHAVNPIKLAEVARESFAATDLELANSDQIRDTWAVGFVGPHSAMKQHDAVLVIDPDAAQDQPWAAGAGETGYHVKNFNWFRECGDRLADLAKIAVADIRYAVAGDLSPAPSGGVLEATRGFVVGRSHARLRDVNAGEFVNATGKREPTLAASCSIDLVRLLLAVAETSHDERGLIWPKRIAPFDIVLTAIDYRDAVQRTADEVYRQLIAAGFSVLLDDRDLRPGIKFTEAELVGAPLCLTIGPRLLAEGKVELKQRRGLEAAMQVPLDQVEGTARQLLEQTI